jgi:mono/diheme cytochrome c family protein
MSTSKLLVLLSCFAACDRPGGPGLTNEFPTVDAAPTVTACTPVSSSQPVPARTDLAASSSGGGVYFTSDLFDLFRSVCGGCHVAANYGGYNVTLNNFSEQVTQQILDARIKSDDPAMYMPPAGSLTGKPYSQRDPTDPVVQLADLLAIWIAQGSSPSSFDLPGGGGESGGPYRLPAAVGAQQTNIGTCVPDRGIVATSTDAMDRLDAFFTAAAELPKTLDQTDLVSFDSEVLARSGVISFAPAYPLWSDDAGKMRHVRVPRTSSIAFDKTTQQFTIPANTRFYKTFLKRIIDKNGNVAWRKIETRLIVSRPDDVDAAGTAHPAALYGTYVWNDDETQAELLQTPLNDGKPFKDRLVSYIVDEPKAKMIRDSNPPNLDYALEVQNPGVLRHYAIPGSDRCVQCHMGSASASFVLGFLPVQIARLPKGQSGVIEDAAGDELTQLQRLIDYGVVSGMASPADVLPLEQTQLPRTPRNDYELTAQAYMIGNCSHCHNPRGFPTMKAPALKNLLNFLPGSAPDAGIFQFPLDRTSPVRARGLRGDVPIPYITPSVRDYPSPLGTSYVPKYLLCQDNPIAGWCLGGPTADFISAPWRSLIYRNVDTPFDYVEDFTIFPHMPMNSPGYDCRAAKIMGDWMVSIPSLPVHPQFDQDAVPGADHTPQPYYEVLPDDPRYPTAVAATSLRVYYWRNGHRYDFCPNTADIVDPAVERGDSQTPVDFPIWNADHTQMIMPVDGVPNRPHWVVTDTTDPPGDWLPRGTEWHTALVDHMAVNPSLTPEALAQLQLVIDDLAGVTITQPVRDALLTEVPFGLWQQKPNCNFTGIPTAGSFQGDARPLWMDTENAAASAPVYMESPAAAVFTNICINCHGPQADAKGLLADEISIMTGGDARVANFRQGLFGPPASPGQNRMRVFGPAVPAGVTADDFGARYMSWMALGGTQKKIPPTLLQIVASTPVLGTTRGQIDAHGSPNMLQLVQELCTHVLPANPNANGALTSFFSERTLDWSAQTALIGGNGDAELWMRICSLNNRPVVRVPVPNGGGSWSQVTLPSQLGIDPVNSLYWADAYPADAPVMDHRGHIVHGITADNWFPLCVERPANAAAAAAADAFLQAHPVGPDHNVIPYCPAPLFETASGRRRWQLQTTPNPETGGVTYSDANHWATRGAINAGFAVFLYVDQLSKGLIMPKPPYDQCELLR